MAVYSVTFKQRVDNYGVVQTLTNTPIEVGQSITLASVGDGLDGTFVVLAQPTHQFVGVDTEGNLLFDLEVQYPNQLLFYDAGDDVQRVSIIPVGTCTWTPTCTWVTAQNILDWLGIAVATASDQTFVTQCAAAANAFSYRRRQEAGYLQDSLTTAPSDDVKLGTIQYGGMLYRQRGSIDSFAQFDTNSMNPVTGLSGVIKQLLGIDRPQVA
jgi:hypothetical protein